MAATGTEDHVALMLVMNKEKTQVLYAEAGKDFVDVLFSFLTFPLGTIAMLVSEDSESKPVRFGCLSSLYESVANLDEDCLTTHVCKEMLLRPMNSAEPYCRNMKLNIDHTEPPKFFMCGSCRNTEYLSSLFLSIFNNIPCRKCGNPMAWQVPKVEDVSVAVGFVNSNANFIVTDGLNVKPNSLGASLTLLKNYGINDTCSLHYLTVNIDKKKVLDLLKCTFRSRKILTHMFLSIKSHPICHSKLYCLNQGAANNGSSQYIVKLFRSKSNGKILFAQGEEDFVNFILSFLSFPLGGVIRMLEGSSGAASFDQLYNSIVDLQDYIFSKEAKSMLIDPQVFSQFQLRNQLLSIRESCSPTYYYHGRRCGGVLKISFDDCLFSINCVPLELIDPKSHTENHKGFVMGPPLMYLVLDDLTVTRITSLSGILGCLDVFLSELEEKEVYVGVNEGLSILKASLTSSSALTNGLGHLFADEEEK